MPAASLRVIEATLSDYCAMMEVRKRNGLSCPTNDEWIHIHCRHPEVNYKSEHVGWLLLNANGKPVGTLETIPLHYELAQEPIRTSAAASWAVDPEFRSASMLLMIKYFAQKDVDLFLNTTANEVGGKVFEAFKAKPAPGPYNQVSMWITDYHRFARAALRNKRIPCSPMVAPFVGAAMSLRDHLFRIRRAKPRLHHSIERIHEFDSRFDELWFKLRQRHERLFAPRTSACLNWHFSYPLKRGAIALALRQGDALYGYAVFRRTDRTDIGLKRLQLTDMQLLEESLENLTMLLETALHYAKLEGIDVVEAFGFREEKHDLFAVKASHKRIFPTWPYYYKAKSKSLKAKLENSSIWDPCPFDGDSGF